MTTAVTLGGSANAPCPTCGQRVAFFSGDKSAFISDVKNFPDDKILQLECKQHGVFEVRAGDFRDRLK